MPWRFWPLHTVAEPATVLPQGGTISIGRRPVCGIVCRDLAVSGQHCILHCHASDLPPDIEDCSTNGTFLNDTKLTKGLRQRLSDADIVSLTKPLEEEVLGGGAAPRIQFRLEFSQADEEPVQVEQPALELERPSRGMSSQHMEVPPTVPEMPGSADVNAACPPAGGDRNFAQDLLVQEQRQKATLTSELLLSQRKLEEERQVADASTRDLKKIRQLVEEERARRHETEEGRDRLLSEVETLRTERRQLQELQTTHEELRRRHEGADAELQARLRRCAELEAAQEQLRFELDCAMEAHRKASQQHAELQTRVRQTQDRTERIEQQLADARRDADRAVEEGARLQREFEVEKAARVQLEEKVRQSSEQFERTEASERRAREALDGATARRAELECQASVAQRDVEEARAAAHLMKQKLNGHLHLVQRLQEAGQAFSAEVRRRMEAWDKALANSVFDGLGTVVVDHAALAQVQGTVCTQEVDTPSRSPHSHRPAAAADGAAGGAADEAAGEGAAAAARPAPIQAGTEAAVPAGAAAGLDNASRPPEVSFAAGGASNSGHADGDGDASDGAADGPAEGLTKGKSLLPSDGARLVLAAPSAPGALAAPVGCSTAWSLEVLDVTDAPLAKRARGDG